MRSIACYQWYEVLQQLLTVAQHPSDLLRAQIRGIVGKVLGMYTEQVLWQVVGMMSVEKSAKYVFMENVLVSILVIFKILLMKDVLSPAKRTILTDALRICRCLISLACSEKVNQEDLLVYQMI